MLVQSEQFQIISLKAGSLYIALVSMIDAFWRESAKLLNDMQIFVLVNRIIRTTQWNPLPEL